MDPSTTNLGSRDDSALERQIAQQSWRPIPPEWQAAILSRPPQPKERRGLAWIFLSLRDLLLPSPIVWGGLTAAWVLVFGFQYAAERTAQRTPNLAAQPNAVTPIPQLGWQAQQALLSQFLNEPEFPTPQPAALPRPRSEGRTPRFGLRITTPTSRTV